jgi:hypothetical protein
MAPISMLVARHSDLRLVTSAFTFFKARGRLRRAFYYTAIIENPEFSTIQLLVDWLDGYAALSVSIR